MHSMRVADSPQTFVIDLDTGDELLSSLKRFAQEKRLSGSSYKAIGALSSAHRMLLNEIQVAMGVLHQKLCALCPAPSGGDHHRLDNRRKPVSSLLN